MSDDPRPIVELRSSTVAEVKFPERIITVLAVPYEQETDKVVYRGRQVVESFARGSFAGVESRNGKVMVNREHTRGRTVGKVATFYPDASEGLIEDIKVASTLAGDETLELASGGMLFPSIGFAIAKGSDQEVTGNRRYIKRAFVDHMAFVEDPAYTGADVVAVRHANGDDDELEDIATPRLNVWLEYVSSRRAGLSA
jgi:phage head maturation protease